MKKYIACIHFILGFIAIFTHVSSATVTNTPSIINSSSVSNVQETSNVGNYTVTMLDAGFWRDWMPIVRNPGLDGGSPLYAHIKFRVSNPSEKDAKLTFSSTLYDQNNQAYPIVFDVQANNQYIWDGTLPSGSDQIVYLVTNNGPYLPVRSTAFVVVNFTDQDGNSKSIRTPILEIRQTF